MFDNTYNLTFDVDTVAMTRVREDNFGSVYFGEHGENKVTMTIKHTIPDRGQGGESHLIRLDYESYSAGVYIGTSSIWTVMKSFDGTQRTTESLNTALALLGFTDSGVVSKLLGRQS